MLDGSLRSKTYTGRAARDVAHEIDHLKGKVFVDRMTPRDNIFLAPHLRKPV
jgi:peptide deformylase